MLMSRSSGVMPGIVVAPRKASSPFGDTENVETDALAALATKA